MLNIPPVSNLIVPTTTAAHCLPFLLICIKSQLLLLCHLSCSLTLSFIELIDFFFCVMGCRVLLGFLLAVAAVIASVDCNSEGDILNAWKTQLTDPNNVLQSWDVTLVNPCTWFHVTCNSENSVTRVDLGPANLSGPLIPELGNLTNLQYLNVFGNKLFGSIPNEIGNLRNLVSLDLHKNNFTGMIPKSFGHLHFLRFLRVFSNSLTGPIPPIFGNLTSLEILELNSNRLTGPLPSVVLELVRFGQLKHLDVSDNLLAGTVHRTNSTRFRVTTIIQDPQA